MHRFIQKRKEMIFQEKNLAANSYHMQAFWILLATFTLSLAYEVYRDTAMAGVTSFDAFNPTLAIFYSASIPPGTSNGEYSPLCHIKDAASIGSFTQ
jgi:hypothetical protein